MAPGDGVITNRGTDINISKKNKSKKLQFVLSTRQLEKIKGASRPPRQFQSSLTLSSGTVPRV